MMKYLDPEQTEARDRQLKNYISKGEAMVTKSVNEIAAVRADFAEWKKQTDYLLHALHDKAGSFSILP
jgi:hypothetical protein